MRTITSGSRSIEKKDLDGAIIEYRKAIRLKSDDFRAHNNLGVALCARATWTVRLPSTARRYV